MNRLLDLIGIPLGQRDDIARQEGAIMTPNDWSFSFLCDASSGKRVWETSSRTLCAAQEEWTPGHVQLILDILQQRPEKDQLRCLLHVLQSVLEQSPRFLHLLTNDDVARMLRCIVQENEAEIQNQILSLLRLVWTYRSTVDPSVFLSVLVDTIEQANENSNGDHPFVRQALDLLKSMVTHPLVGSSHRISVEDVVHVLTVYWMSRPGDLEFLDKFFEIVDSTRICGYAAVACFNLASSVFLSYSQSPSPEKAALSWLAAGLLSNLALKDDNILREFMMFFLPRVLKLSVPSQSIIEGFLRRATWDQCRLRIMEIIEKASTTMPDLLTLWRRELHELRMHKDSWALQSLLRSGLQNIGEVAPRNLPLTAHSPDQLLLVLIEHGIPLQNAKKVTMNGTTFMQTPLRELASQMDLSREQTSVVGDIQSAYSYMQDISGRVDCGWITNHEMGRFLQSVRQSPHRAYIPLVESCHCSDGNYYLHRIVAFRSCLDVLTVQVHPQS